MLRLLGQQVFRERPRWIAYPATLALVALAFAAGQWFWPAMRAYPFFFYYPAIILVAVLFNHGCGYLAVGLSAALIPLWLEPFGSIRIALTRDWFAWAMFLGIGLLLSFLLDQLRQGLDRARAAELQKDLFLQEAVHRFKNDITIITALLRIQSRRLGDSEAKAILLNTTNRVQVMARVHDRLRINQATTPEVDASAFIEELCEDRRASLLDLRPITMTIEAEAHRLAHEQAVAVGLIINEALTNALKYAFPDERAGAVRIVFQRQGSDYVLQVSDNGVGFDPARPSRQGGTGRRLVQSMAQQLGGELTIKPDEGQPGTRVTVRFPRQSAGSDPSVSPLLQSRTQPA
ncbi:sensor histidine kinase [Methylorubrum extorquens]